jgi:hypothetical protein
MPWLDPLLEEFLVAAASCTALGVAVAAVYWLITGSSPWPGLVLGEIAGFGLGVVLLTLASPKRSR